MSLKLATKKHHKHNFANYHATSLGSKRQEYKPNTEDNKGQECTKELLLVFVHSLYPT
jgi:hypothetical protein